MAGAFDFFDTDDLPVELERIASYRILRWVATAARSERSRHVAFALSLDEAGVELLHGLLGVDPDLGYQAAERTVRGVLSAPPR